ncbi:cytochrome P450 [Coprinopsis sp. MPI-PUGE-AT-0042]|nr:cytochrome P450 [Coprinopsis sp. MPI-PUGE-AT-0042]
MNVLTTPASALVLHLYFRKHEPSPMRVLATVLGHFGVLTAARARVDGSVSNAAFGASTTTLALVFWLCVSIMAYRLSPWHPLARFPGPALARVSKWFMVHRILVKGGRHTILRELHERHGPYVRIGPNEVSVNSAAATRQVYRLDRGPFYSGTPAKGESLITEMNRKRHAQRRQAWSKAVVGTVILNYVPDVKKRVSQLISILVAETAKQRRVSLDYWINLFFLDLMGDIGFSGGFETMNAGSDEDGLMATLYQGIMFVSSMGQVPWLRSLFQLLPQPGPLEIFQKFTEQKVEGYRRRSGREMQRDIFSSVIDCDNGAPELTKDEIAADAALVVVAATDTGVQTVVSLVRYVSEKPEMKNRLQQEVDTAFSDMDDMDVDAVLRLPYLDACLQETLRIMPPGPCGPPRTSGEAGVQIQDTWFPPNTTLHVPVYTMHRDASNFGDFPDQFIPERWLPEEKAHFNINQDAFLPFSSGYSSCVGKHLAIQNIKIMLACVYHSLDLALADGLDLAKFDASYKEHSLWSHDALDIVAKPRHRKTSRL